MVSKSYQIYFLDYTVFLVLYPTLEYAKIYENSGKILHGKFSYKELNINPTMQQCRKLSYALKNLTL